MRFILVILALVAGAFMPVQAGVNAKLRLVLGDPVLAALVSFAVGTLALAAYSAAARLPLPPASALGGNPWWIWTGGCLGAFFVAVTVFLAPKLGAASMMSFIIAGQLAASIALDHYGLIGYAVREASLPRIIGAVLLAVGAVLVQRY